MFERSLEIEKENFKKFSTSEGVDEIYRLFQKKSLTSNNKKTVLSLRSCLHFCAGKTTVCKNGCYACRFPLAYKCAIENRVKKNVFIMNFPDIAIKKLSLEIPYKGFLRVNDVGDLASFHVPIIEGLANARPDVKFSVISRNLKELSSLSDRFLKIFSLDFSFENIPTQTETERGNLYFSFLAENFSLDFVSFLPSYVSERLLTVFCKNGQLKNLPEKKVSSLFCRFQTELRGCAYACTLCQRCFK